MYTLVSIKICGRCTYVHIYVTREFSVLNEINTCFIVKSFSNEIHVVIPVRYTLGSENKISNEKKKTKTTTHGWISL